MRKCVQGIESKETGPVAQLVLAGEVEHHVVVAVGRRHDHHGRPQVPKDRHRQRFQGGRVEVLDRFDQRARGAAAALQAQRGGRARVLLFSIAHGAHTRIKNTTKQTAR